LTPENEGESAAKGQSATLSLAGPAPIAHSRYATMLRSVESREVAVSVEVPRAFSAVTALVPEGDGRFAGAVDPEWTILGKPNGGYLLAMLGRAAAAVAGHEHVIAASATYLRAPDPGKAVITAEVLRAGRSATQVRAALAQDDVPCVEALFTVATLNPGTAPYWAAGLPAMSTVPFDACRRLEPRAPTGRVAIMDQVEVRIETDTWGWTRGEPSGRGELRGWLALPDGEDFTDLSLLYAVDAFPPATFDITLSGWVPTLSMSAYVRALPAPGPVRVLHRAQLIEDGRVDEVCFVWDGTGRMVAQCTQLAGIRLA
jgi:acyl-coenzyme A thioesterase PaaI-like protein